MRQKFIKNKIQPKHDSAIESVQWPTCSLIDKQKIDKQVFAIQTSRIAPHKEISQLSSSCPLPYGEFNLGLHVGDSAEKVEKNRHYLQHLLPLNTKIQWLEQVHGNQVVEVSKVTTQIVTADAAITRNKNICLAIMTADCLPILLVSKSGDEIAAIHGGWRPLAANIIRNTLELMHTPAADVYAWLGPCISQKVFEIGQEVKNKFVEQNEYFDVAFIAKEKGKYLADLHHIAHLQLANLGVKHVSALPECTYSNPDKYYSYRKNSVTGRMATLICRV